MKKGKDYEELVAGIYRELSPMAKVVLNDKILGRNTNGNREIDVSIRSEIAGHKILIAVQVRDRKTPADINQVGEFQAVLQDIGASSGVLICSAGFTKRARDAARSAKIDLCTAYDASTRKWKKDIKVPLLVIYIEREAKMRFTLLTTPEFHELNKNPVVIGADMGSAVFSYDKGKTHTSLIKEVSERVKDEDFYKKKLGLMKSTFQYLDWKWR